MRQKRLRHSDSINSLHQLRYEKAKLKLEIIYLEQEIQAEAQSWFQGGLLHSAGMGMKMFASTEKWFIYWKLIKKVWKWGKEKYHKFQQQKKQAEKQ